MTKGKRLNTQSKKPVGRPRKIKRTPPWAIPRGHQVEEETSAADSEPRRQPQTNEEPSLKDTPDDLPQQPPLHEPEPEPEPELDSGTMAGRIRSRRRNAAQVAERVLEESLHDEAFDHDTNGVSETDDPVYDPPQQRRPRKPGNSVYNPSGRTYKN